MQDMCRAIQADTSPRAEEEGMVTRTEDKRPCAGGGLTRAMPSG